VQVIVNTITILVPSGTIKEKIAPGADTVLERVCFHGGKIKNRIFNLKTQIYTTNRR